MGHYRLAFMGFGNVGKALAKLLLGKQAELQQRYGIPFSATGIASGRYGLVIDPDGIDLELAQRASDLSSLSKGPKPVDALDFIRQCGADVLFENTPVNYETASRRWTTCGWRSSLASTALRRTRGQWCMPIAN